MTNSDILNELKPNDNYTLSDMSFNEIRDILRFICAFKPIYREILSFKGNPTFGFELEIENVSKDNLSKKLENYPRWNIVEERSLTNGIEVVSPVSCNTIEFWKTFRVICAIARENGTILDNAASHIHIGADYFKKERFVSNFLLLWKNYENIFYRFYFGESTLPREHINSYAKPIAGILSDNPSMNELSQNRDYAINFKNTSSFNVARKKNTVELRVPNGTLNEIVWQNNLNTLINAIEYSKKKGFELPYQTTEKDGNLTSYCSINIIEALNLADLIFTNNLDKLYFLKQYFKNFSDEEEKTKTLGLIS